MSLVKKLVVGSAIGVGAIGVGAGYSLFKFGKYVRKLIYPPTVSKYIALAVLPFVMYSVKHPEEVIGGIKQTSQYARNYFHSDENKEDGESKRIVELEEKLNETSLKSDFYKKQYLSHVLAESISLPQAKNSNQSLALQEISIHPLMGGSLSALLKQIAVTFPEETKEYLVR